MPAKSSRIAAPPKLVTAPAVQQAVTSLSIELGEGASPIPHDALLLLGSAKLLHLKVTLVVTSGMWEDTCSTCWYSRWSQGVTVAVGTCKLTIHRFAAGG